MPTYIFKKPSTTYYYVTADTTDEAREILTSAMNNAEAYQSHTEIQEDGSFFFVEEKAGD